MNSTLASPFLHLFDAWNVRLNFLCFVCLYHMHSSQTQDLEIQFLQATETTEHNLKPKIIKYLFNPFEWVLRCSCTFFHSEPVIYFVPIRS